MPKGNYPDTEKYIKLGIAGKSKNKYDAKGNLRPQRKSRAKDPNRFKKAVEEKTGYKDIFQDNLLGKIVQKGVDEGQDDLAPILKAVKPQGPKRTTDERIIRYEPSKYGPQYNIYDAKYDMERKFINRELRRQGIKEPERDDYMEDVGPHINFYEDDYEEARHKYRMKSVDVGNELRTKFNDPSNPLYKEIRENNTGLVKLGDWREAREFETNYDLVHKQLEAVRLQTENRQHYAVVPLSQEDYEHNKKYGHLIPSKYRARSKVGSEEQPLKGIIMGLTRVRTEKFRDIEPAPQIKDVKDITTTERLQSYMDLTKHRGTKKFVIPAQDRKRLRQHIKEHYKDEYGIGRDGVLKLRTRARPKTQEEKDKLKQDAIDRQNKQVQDFFSSIPPAPRDDNANLTLSEANIKMKIAEVNKPLPPPPPNKEQLLESAKQKVLSRIEKGKTKLVERQTRAKERAEEVRNIDYWSLPAGSSKKAKIKEIIEANEERKERKYVDLTDPTHDDFGIAVGQPPPPPTEGFYQDPEGFYYEDVSWNAKGKLYDLVGVEEVDKYRSKRDPLEKIKTGMPTAINPSNLPVMGNPLPKWARKEYIKEQMDKTQAKMDELSAKTKYTVKRKKIKKKLVVKELPTIDTEPERKWDTDWTDGYSKGYPKGLSAKESKFLTLAEAVEGAKQHGKKVRAITKQKYGKKGQTLYTLRGSGGISAPVKDEQTIFLR